MHPGVHRIREETVAENGLGLRGRAGAGSVVIHVHECVGVSKSTDYGRQCWHGPASLARGIAPCLHLTACE